VLSVNGPGRVRHRLFLLLPLLLASIAIPAGRSDAAEDEVSAAQVAEGLKTIQDIAGDVALAAGRDKAKAEKISEAIEPVWSKIEDKLRDNDKDAYITFEDSFETLAAAAKAGDAKKASGAADKVAAAVKAYVAKYPADAPAPAPAAPSVPAARAADAAAPAPAPAAVAAPAAGDATLARTGGATSALTALAGIAFGLGGLAVIAGARRRLSPIS
jgi:hypothetical protein